MTRRWNAPLLIAALLAGSGFGGIEGACAARPDKSASPVSAELRIEQLAELYLDVGLRGELASARRINDYLRPSMPRGEDKLDLQRIAKTPDLWKQKHAQIADELLEAMPAVDRKQVRPTILAALQTQHDAALRSACQIVSVSVRADERDENQPVNDVIYQCEVPGAPGALDELQEATNASNQLSTEQAIQNFQAFAQAFDSDYTHKMRGTLQFRSLGDRWYTDDFGGIVSAVVQAMELEPGRRVIDKR